VKGVTYAEAVQACADDGGRLCTQFEVEEGAGTGGGCLFNSHYVWTSTPCNAMYMIADGYSGNDGHKPSECTSVMSTNGFASNAFGTEIGVQCCNDAGTVGNRPEACLKGVTYAEAEQACAGQGDRLCTQSEVEADVGMGTGCDFNSYHVWTSTPCNSQPMYPTDGMKCDIRWCTPRNRHCDIGNKCCLFSFPPYEGECLPRDDESECLQRKEDFGGYDTPSPHDDEESTLSPTRDPTYDGWGGPVDAARGNDEKQHDAGHDVIESGEAETDSYLGAALVSVLVVVAVMIIMLALRMRRKNGEANEKVVKEMVGVEKDKVKDDDDGKKVVEEEVPDLSIEMTTDVTTAK